jgi:putative DNA primase/helicase
MQERGHFIQPQSAAEAIQTVADLASPVSAFIRDRCDVGPDYEVSAVELFQAWRDYCHAQGREHTGTLQTFARDLHAALPCLKIVRRRVGDTRERVYRGIRLKVLVSSEGFSP